MKQTISVNLNRQVFYLDLDAYDTLKKYLEEIKKHFNKESEEIVDDIEARIAEKFNDIVGKSKGAIQLMDVTRIIGEMETVDAITENEDSKEENSDSKKKLFRDPDNKIIAGIAAGLGWYFGVKSIWIRIIFVVLLVNHATFWLAIVGYLAGWAVISEAKTSWEKLEMKGKPTTVNELQTAIEEKIINKNIFQRVVSAFIKLIKFCIIWTCRLSGLFIFVSIIMAIVGMVVGLVFVYFEPAIPYFDLSFLKEIRTPFLEVMFVAMGVMLLTPLVLVMDFADSLMRWKWTVSVKKIMVMLSVWIAAVLLFSGIAKTYYPKYGQKLMNSINKVKYLTWIDDSNSKTLDVKNVTDIAISSVREVTITEGPINEVKIVGSQYAIDELNSNYINGKLTIFRPVGKMVQLQGL